MIYLTQIVYLQEGHEEEFLRFEDKVLPLLTKYRGELVLRLRPDASAFVAGIDEPPYEVHIVRFESTDDLDRFSRDEERLRALPLKQVSVRSTLTIRGSRLSEER